MIKNDKITQINIGCSLLLQLSAIVSGFIIPRIILQLFGSEVNGLISSITQFLNYIQLVEGGLGGVVMAALYVPLNKQDDKTIAGIVKASSLFFRRIGIIYIVYLICLSLLYPQFKETGFNYKYSIVLILVLGANLVVQYFLSISYRLLLNADRKIYVVAVTQTVINILNVFLVIISSHLFEDVLIIKLCSALAFLVQPLVFTLYVNKHYKIDKKVSPNKEALNQRWVAFGTNLAYFVHTNTDIVILTVFSSFASISVYSVYLLVVTAIKAIVSAISSAFVPTFGKALAVGDNYQLNKSFASFEFIVQISSFVLFTCGAVLIVPFVMLYTNGITDADYNQPVFAVLLIIAEFIYCLRDPFVQATSAAAMFRRIAPHAYIEAISNIVISIVLVREFGIVGVAIGTIIAMIYRMVAQIIIVNRHILKRSVFKSFINVVSLISVLLLVYIIFQFLGPKSLSDIGAWIVYAFVVFVVVVTFAFLLCITIYKESFRAVIMRKKNV